jgi:inner membrane protein
VLVWGWLEESDDMPWWGWVVTGFLLLGAEMFGVDAQFYLVFIGAAAIVVGLLEASGLHLPDWAQWLTFTVLAVGCMALFRARLYRRFRAHAGDRLTVPETLAAQASCRVEYRGTTWTARNTDDAPLAAGSEAEVWEVAGLTLHLRHPR